MLKHTTATPDNYQGTGKRLDKRQGHNARETRLTICESQSCASRVTRAQLTVCTPGGPNKAGKEVARAWQPVTDRFDWTRLCFKDVCTGVSDRAKRQFHAVLTAPTLTRQAACVPPAGVYVHILCKTLCGWPLSEDLLPQLLQVQHRSLQLVHHRQLLSGSADQVGQGLNGI